MGREWGSGAAAQRSGGWRRGEEGDRGGCRGEKTEVPTKLEAGGTKMEESLWRMVNVTMTNLNGWAKAPELGVVRVKEG